MAGADTLLLTEVHGRGPRALAGGNRHDAHVWMERAGPGGSFHTGFCDSDVVSPMGRLQLLLERARYSWLLGQGGHAESTRWSGGRGRGPRSFFTEASGKEGAKQGEQTCIAQSWGCPSGLPALE